MPYDTADSRDATKLDAPTREPEEKTRARPETERPSQERPRQDREGRNEDGGGKQQKRRSPLLFIVLGIVVLIAAIGGAAWWWSVRNLEGTDDAYTDGRAIAISPKVAGYVLDLRVNDNQFVHAGDLILQINPRDFIVARNQARGNYDIAVAQTRSARLGAEIARKNFPARLEQAQAQMTQARAQLYQAQTEYNRQHNIARSATTQQSIDQATAGLRSAEGQVQAAEAAVQEAQPVQQNIEQSDRQVDQLQAQVDQAKAQLDQAELNLSYTRLIAPQDGWVTKRNVERGTYIQVGGTIMYLVSPDVWVTANFKESQLARMRPGQRADISVDAYPFLKLHGHVDSVQLGSGSKFTAFPPENATGNYVKIVQRVPVKIDIDSGLDPNLPLPLGLSVEPTVYLK